MNAQKGISLLEVLAALVILSIGATVAFTWLGQSASTMHRLKQEEKLILIKFEAIEYIRSINPMDNSQGRTKINDYDLQWSSTPSQPIQRSLNSRGGQGNYEIGLFKTEVKISKSNEVALNFTINSSGYKKISNANSGISW